MDINVSPSSSTFVKSDSAAKTVQQMDVVDSKVVDNQNVSESDVAQSNQSEPESSQEQLSLIADQLSETMSMMRKGLAFRVDDDSGKNVVSVMDIESGDIIRQIPSEEALKLATKLSEVAGLLMKTEA
ncbi:hypothetical protein HR45_13995 [Shewanella mangrovi]|uniref:Flagellar protein FlaG n=1 Tax=Shewanella mangrovi TaxID=1515746 RepID=A0A094LP47_9GAMM|nr:flagellar protein FlaG [Shewanella mangrovi]KFZ36908.1 hypothetical protein HR45_13995 [Shewanella mangrovi]